MRLFLTAAVFALAATPVLADEPDGLKLPPGFHASVVAEGLGAVRHLAVRDNGDIYVSTGRGTQPVGGGIIALHLDADHKADQTEHFGVVNGGTGIRFDHGALYATSPSRVWRFNFKGKDLLPDPEPQVIVDGMGVQGANRAIAFDGKGNLYVALVGTGNICTDPKAPKGSVPVGIKPCPDLATRAGIWRFSATKQNQKFPSDGEQIATGIRDSSSLDWSRADGALYSIVHGRDGTHQGWPNLVSAADDDHIADEMHRVVKGTDMGWPYTYYDGVRKMRLVAPEYGGDGKTAPTDGNYSTPVATFHSGRAAPLDLVFYNGSSFPAEYRNGAFVVLHGTGGAQLPQGHNGYDVMFIPFGKKGVAGEPQVFADGFAGPDASSKNNGHAKYRPSGAAVGPDGALYVVDSQKGRLWRIFYGNPG